MSDPSTTPVAVNPSRPRCSARRSTDGEPCRNYPVPGGTVCRYHGGRARQVARAAGRRQAVEDARREVRRLGISVDVDPLDVLLDLVRESAGNVAAYRLVVEGLGIHVGPDGVATEGASGQGYSVPDDAHVLVKMYDAERDRLARYAKLCLDAGVDERRVRVAEGTAQRLAGALGRALDSPEVGLSSDQRAALQRVLAGELRGLGAAA